MREIKFRAWDREAGFFLDNTCINAMVEGKKVAGQHPPKVEEHQEDYVELVPSDSSSIFAMPREVRYTKIKMRAIYQPVESFQGNPFTMERLVLMQYTGLKDKNGNELYEGDLLKHDLWGVHEIVWDNESASFRAVNKEKDNDLNLGHAQLKRCKIVGNIWES